MTKLIQSTLLVIIIAVLSGCAVYPSHGSYYSPSPYFSHYSFGHGHGYGHGSRRW
ncbi:MAG: hypothetical protein WCL27_06960 [Betaproteobacteria bacterium]